MSTLDSLRSSYLRHVIVPMARLAGPRAVAAVAGRLASAASDLNPPGRARGMRRIVEAVRDGIFELHGAEAAGFLRASYRHFGRFWAESIFLESRLTESNWRRFVACQNEAGLQSLANCERGCLIAVSYHGNIAAAACALGHVFKPIHVVMDAALLPNRGVWQPMISKLPHVRIIERGEAGREIPRVLENGGTVMMVAEHERTRGRGVPVRFMGRSFEAYPTIGRLAEWFDAPVAVVTCPRGDGAFGFELKLHEVIDPHRFARDDCADLQSSDRHAGDGCECLRRENELGYGLTRRMMAALEKGVLETPEQYLWSVPTREAGLARNRRAEEADRAIRNRMSLAEPVARRSVSVEPELVGASGHRR